MAQNIKQKWLYITKVFASQGITQTAVAQGAEVDQSSVSRILAHCPRREGQAFRKICKYASKLNHASIQVDPSANAELMASLQEVWNGSDEHALALAAIIRAAGYATEVGGR